MATELLAARPSQKPPALDQVSIDLREYALSLGAELYGVASADAYAEHFPDKPQPAQLVENARSIIIIG